MKGLTASPAAPFPHGLHFHTSLEKHKNMVLATPHWVGSCWWEEPVLRLLYQDYIKRHRQAASHCHDAFQNFLLLKCLRERRERSKKHLLEIEENCQGNQQGCYRQSMTNDRHIIKYERHLQFKKKKRQAWITGRHLVCFLIKEESKNQPPILYFFFFQTFF